jgi:hypothetical protein
VVALAEMYVSTRKADAIPEEPVRPQLLRPAISAINVRLDDGLAEFARRRLDDACRAEARSRASSSDSHGWRDSTARMLRRPSQPMPLASSTAWLRITAASLTRT